MRGSVRTSSAGPSMKSRPCSMTRARSEIKRAPRTFCSTTSTVTPLRRDALHGGEDVALHLGREAERGLVEQQQRRLDQQHHGHFQDLLLAARQVAGIGAPFLAQHGERAGDAVDGGVVHRLGQGVAAHFQVLGHRHRREIATALRHEADAALEALPRRQALDGLALEHDLAAEQAVGAVDRAQQGRLAGAIAADQRRDRAGLQAGRELAHDRHVAVARRHRDQFEGGVHAAPRISASAISGVMPR